MIVSIIIAVKIWQKNLEECVNKCSSLDYPDIEIIILPDESIEGVSLPLCVKVVPTGNVTPPLKRDIGAKAATGEILAFLDDDAYPVSGWLESAIKIFKENPDYACVCGPAVTPLDDSLREKASGFVYSSFLMSCGQIYRYLPRRPRFVVDYPSCNFLIRKEIFDKVGGFDTKFWPGEDTFLCLKVLETGKKMYYHPKVLVFHHRRSLFKKHLSQIRSYAMHRGYFAKRYPKTSLRWDYFIPSAFVAFLVVGPFIPWATDIYVPVVLFYITSCLLTSLILGFKAREGFLRKLRLVDLIFTGIVMSHIIYGIFFVKGLLASQMPEEKL
ncbi:MAG: glycosyltransferase [Candidatus Aceula meridiana]|nr:glycosyltransferase [Candidatus Aceula meridiana]